MCKRIIFKLTMVIIRIKYSVVFMSYITNETLPNYVPHEILLMIIEETCRKTFVLTFTTIRFVIKQLLCRLEVSTTVVHSEQEQFS